MIRRLLTLFAGAALAACQPADTTPAAQAPDSPAYLELGRKVYNFRCYYCHGYSGDARTLAATFLTPAPRDFTAPGAAQLSRESMIQAIRDGRPDSAMAAFGNTLSTAEIEAVTDFIRDEFVRRRAENTRYHTAENGWFNHERYRAAFPFATGDIALDAPVAELTPEQVAGRQLFMTTCVSCHDRGRPTQDEIVWKMRALSYPPNADACVSCHRYSAALRDWDDAAHARVAAVNKTHAVPGSPFEKHDVAPRLDALSARERRGEQLFQQNCAFCHAADGSGKNWIGIFLEPHARDLTDPRFRSRTSRQALVTAIRDGLPGTSMPAWKSVLEDEEIEAIVAYLARAFGPPGK